MIVIGLHIVGKGSVEILRNNISVFEQTSINSDTSKHKMPHYSTGYSLCGIAQTANDIRVEINPRRHLRSLTLIEHVKKETKVSEALHLNANTYLDQTGIQLLRFEASDHLSQPPNPKLLTKNIASVTQRNALHTEHTTLERSHQFFRFGPMLGGSPAMHSVYDQISRVAPTTASVLITGESGTGKELVAHTLHELSDRNMAPFIAVNCGAVSPLLIESEMFGHEKGSFTGAIRQHKGHFERANGGTIFLDEISEMPADLQVKLLRVLETGLVIRVGSDHEIKVDVRVIAATNRTPQEAVSSGKLREDLFYRLQTFPLTLPPLRARGSDIEQLALYFLNVLNKKDGKNKTLSSSAMDKLRAHQWPGNIRELKNVMHRAYILSDSIIDIRNLPVDLNSRAIKSNESDITLSVGCSIAEAERQLIVASLKEYDGNKERTAAILGISLKTLYTRLHAYAAQDLKEKISNN